MNGKRAKQLRKQANYKKTKNVEVVGDYNINIGSGKSFKVLNVPKTEQKEISEIEKTCKKVYKDLKLNYKSV